ncbi:MAG TPA: hypothetical protein VEV87_06505 [Chitinophagaceae bacterium]|nr:hypothetical protein [Chitinophagaceae bacterium]
MRLGSRLLDHAATVFLVFLIIYLLSLTSNFTGPHDSMAYLKMLQSREHLWHPHHLLYHQLSYYWLHLLKYFFPMVENYFLVESFSSLFGAGTIAVSYLFFRKRFHLPVLTSWMGCGIIGFSYGVWFYSINVEVYGPSLFFTLASLYQLTKREWDAQAVWLTAIFHSLAILFHQMNILLTPIVLYKIVEQRKHIFVFKSIFWYGLTGIVLVGGTYFLAGRYGEGHADLSSWMEWVKGYTTTGEYWRPLSLKTPLLAGAGFTHAILGGHFVFKVGLERWVTSLLHTHSLQDEYFLVQHMSRESGRLLLVLSIFLFVFISLLLIKFLLQLKWITRNYFYVIIPLILYFLIYSIYFLFWMPEILEFWIGQTVVFWLLIIGGHQSVNRRVNILLAGILILLTFINYAGSILPMQNINNDIGYIRIQKVREQASGKDMVLVQNPWLLKEFLQYYTPAQVAQNPKSIQEADSLSQIVQTQLKNGNKVFIFINRNESIGNSNPDFLSKLIEQNKARATLIQEKPAEVWLLK